MKHFVTFIVLMAFTKLIIAQDGFVIDHTSTVLSEIPANWIDSAKSNLKIQYFRRSHGSHIDVGGMAALRRYSSAYADKYNYNATGSGGALKLSTTWHSLDFENSTWVQLTRNFLDNAANSDINVMMWAWSSGFYNYDVEQYISDMEMLIGEYGPGGTEILSGDRTVPVTFVFHTACSQKSTARSQIVFNGNQRIRQHCSDSDRILFDFNDIESYNPNGDYFGDIAPDNTYTNERLLHDDCSYTTPSNVRGNWGMEWNAANPSSELAELSADDICVTCEHSMGTHEGETKDNSRLHCVLKGQAVWRLWARLAGWGQKLVKIKEDIALIETNLNGRELAVKLEGYQFSGTTATLANYQLNNAPAGLSIQSVTINDNKNALAVVSFDGTDFINDIPNLNLSILADEITENLDITSNNLLVKAVNETANNWTGDLSKDWGNAQNWSEGTVPNQTNNVLIPSGLANYPETNSIGDIQLSNLSMEAGAQFQFPAGNNLQINNDLTLVSGANDYAQIIDNNNINVLGTIYYRKFLKGSYYHYISSPLSATAPSVFTSTPKGYNTNFFTYVESNGSSNWLQGWDHASAIANNLQIANGYAYYYVDNFSFSLSGGALNSGDISVDVNHSNNATISDGWNLLGNPYASAISADEFIYENRSIINGTIYFWDDDNSNGANYRTADYASWNLAGSIGTGTGSGSETGLKIPDGFIAPMQGFFVKKIDPGTSQVHFLNAMRRFGNGQFYKNKETPIRLKLSLLCDSLKLYNETLLAFMEQASDGFDNLYDGIKLHGNSDISFYSNLNEQCLAIQSFALNELADTATKSIPLGLFIGKDGDYEISIVLEEGISEKSNIYLEDKELSTYHDLKMDGKYKFSMLEGTYDDRFVIHFEPNISLNMKTVDKELQLKVFYAANSIVIDVDETCIGSTYRIYSIKGILLKKGIVNAGRMIVPVEANYKAALVKIQGKNVNLAAKVILIN